MDSQQVLLFVYQNHSLLYEITKYAFALENPSETIMLSCCFLKMENYLQTYEKKAKNEIENNIKQKENELGILNSFFRGIKKNFYIDLINSKKLFFKKYLYDLYNRKKLMGTQKTIDDFESEKLFSLYHELNLLEIGKNILPNDFVFDHFYEKYLEIKNLCKIMNNQTTAQLFMETIKEEKKERIILSKERRSNKNKGKKQLINFNQNIVEITLKKTYGTLRKIAIKLIVSYHLKK